MLFKLRFLVLPLAACALFLGAGVLNAEDDDNGDENVNTSLQVQNADMNIAADDSINLDDGATDSWRRWGRGWGYGYGYGYGGYGYGYGGWGSSWYNPYSFYSSYYPYYSWYY